MNPPPHLFVIFSRGTSQAEVDQGLAILSNQLKVFLGKDVNVTDSLSWYRETFDRCGNWDSWIYETVCGRDYHTRELRFSGFVVMARSLGRANASIVDLAMSNRRAVLYFDGKDTIEIVDGIEQSEPEALASGWTVNTQPMRD